MVAIEEGELEPWIFVGHTQKCRLRYKALLIILGYAITTILGNGAIAKNL